MVKRQPAWEPTNEDYSKVFREQSPWYTTGKVPDALALEVERPLAKELWRLLVRQDFRRHQVILGPRRVGKTTTMYQTVRHLLNNGIERHRVWWFRLDHPLLINLPILRLAKFAVSMAKATPQQPAFLLFDELTYGKEWDLWLKSFYDDRWPVVVAGTSSSTAALRERRLESGVGRWDEQYLAPYLFDEFLSLIGEPISLTASDDFLETLRSVGTAQLPPSLHELRHKFLLTGGFPELLIHFHDKAPDDETRVLQSQRTLRNDAVERAIYKDIPQVFGVNDPIQLERLLYTLAGQIGGILSPTSLCKDLGNLSQPTFDRYLSYLERSYLVFTLPNYSSNEAKTQRRGRKLYFVDSAVRNAALQRGLGPLTNPSEMGHLLENLVASHMHSLSQQSQHRLFYWREGKLEVDLIYASPLKPLAFEVATHRDHPRQALGALMERFPSFRGGCFVLSTETVFQMPSEANEHIGTIPIDLFLIAVGLQTSKHLHDRVAV